MFYELLTKPAFAGTITANTYSCDSGVTATVFSREPSMVELAKVMPDNCMEILFCTDGRVQVDMLSGRCLEVETGQIMMINQCAYIKRACIPHQNLSGVLLRIPGWENINGSNVAGKSCTCNESEPDICRFKEMLLSRRGCVVIDRCPWSTEIFDQLQCLSRHAQGELCVGKIRELMCLVCQDEYFPPDVDGKYFDSFRLSPARSAHDYIREHLSGPLTIHSLAARFNVSPTALKESFHRVYGRSIHRYIRSVRLDAAAKMLLDTTLEVRQISRAVGYSSPSQFTNAFKYRYGMAPGQYRRNKNVI